MSDLQIEPYNPESTLSLWSEAEIEEILMAVKEHSKIRIKNPGLDNVSYHGHGKLVRTPQDLSRVLGHRYLVWTESDGSLCVGYDPQYSDEDD